MSNVSLSNAILKRNWDEGPFATEVTKRQLQSINNRTTFSHRCYMSNRQRSQRPTVKLSMLTTKWVKVVKCPGHQNVLSSWTSPLVNKDNDKNIKKKANTWKEKGIKRATQNKISQNQINKRNKTMISSNKQKNRRAEKITSTWKHSRPRSAVDSLDSNTSPPEEEHNRTRRVRIRRTGSSLKTQATGDQNRKKKSVKL